MAKIMFLKGHFRGRGVGGGEESVEGLEGEMEQVLGQVLGLLAGEEGAVILRVGEGFAEEEGVAAPMGDGVAMKAGLSRGVSRISAFCLGGNDCEFCSFVRVQELLDILPGLKAGDSTAAHAHAHTA
jgi:hypothetical protein